MRPWLLAPIPNPNLWPERYQDEEDEDIDPEEECKGAEVLLALLHDRVREDVPGEGEGEGEGGVRDGGGDGG